MSESSAANDPAKLRAKRAAALDASDPAGDEESPAPSAPTASVPGVTYPRCESCGCHIVYLHQTSHFKDKCGDCVRLDRFERIIRMFEGAMERMEG